VPFVILFEVNVPIQKKEALAFISMGESLSVIGQM
jgi:hypothetical protein